MEDLEYIKGCSTDALVKAEMDFVKILRDAQEMVESSMATVEAVKEELARRRVM